jgi:toxin-antitoxin system PIN domain toxin
VWLALTFDAHVHHPDAKRWFDGLASNVVCYFCRLTQQGFLRRATNPHVFGRDALSLTDAWQKYDLLMGDPRVSFAEEPAQTEIHWRNFTQSQFFSAQVWTDAYLAGFALAGGFELVTFDKGFARYQNVATIILP